jgi:hypothetical protein
MSAEDRLRAAGLVRDEYFKLRPPAADIATQQPAAPKAAFARVYDNFAEPQETEAARIKHGGYLRPSVRLNALRPLQSHLQDDKRGMDWHMRPQPALHVAIGAQEFNSVQRPEFRIKVGDPFDSVYVDKGPEFRLTTPFILSQPFDHIDVNASIDAECNPLEIPRTRFSARGRAVLRAHPDRLFTTFIFDFGQTSAIGGFAAANVSLLASANQPIPAHSSLEHTTKETDGVNLRAIGRYRDNRFSTNESEGLDTIVTYVAPGASAVIDIIATCEIVSGSATNKIMTFQRLA